MSEGRTAATKAHRVGSGASRVVRAWRVMPHERRLAAYAAIGLVVTLFLPWYQETVIAPSQATKLQSASASLTGWGAFSFVEAAVLLVAGGVLTLLLQRAEGRAFHIPGGDGGVITAAGAWTCVLVIWRIFDKQGTSSHGQFATTSGIEWGIFVALAVAAFLAYSGTRIRAAHRPEPPLPGEAGPSATSSGPDGPVSEPPAPPPSRHDAGFPPAPRHAGLPAAPRDAGPRAAARQDSGPPAAARQDAGPPAAARRERVRPTLERPPGWLSAPPNQRQPRQSTGSAASPRPDSRPSEQPAPPPKPVPADDPPTVRAERDPDAPPPPSTAAARRQKQPDEELTTPIERED